MALASLRAALTVALLTASATTTAWVSPAAGRRPLAALGGRKAPTTAARTTSPGHRVAPQRLQQPLMALEGPFLAAAQQDLALALVVLAEGAGCTATNPGANWKTGAIGAAGAAALAAGWVLMGQSFIAGAVLCSLTSFALGATYVLRLAAPGGDWPKEWTAGTLVGCVAGFAVFVQSSFYVGAWTPPANQVSSQIDANIAKYANNPYAETEAPSAKPAAPELDIPKLPPRLDAVIPVEPAVEKPSIVFDGSN